MTRIAFIITLSLIAGSCGPSDDRRIAPAAQPQTTAAQTSPQDVEIIRVLVECGQFYATLAGIGSRARDPRMSEGARNLSNRFGGLAGSHARARDIPFATFQRISDQAEASIRTQRQNINGLISNYSDYCKALGEANGLS
jgi:hypothetical protein